MRHIRSSIRGFTAIALIYLIAIAGRTSSAKDELLDLVKGDTVWRGVIVHNKTAYSPDSKPDAMVLYVKQRKGSEFRGFTWYPNEGNGVLRVTGKVDREGKVTFTEDKVIHGEETATNKRSGVQAGNKFIGQLAKKAINGTGRWTGPAFNGEIRMRFSLKLAE